MRWLTVAGVLLYLTRCNDAGALKCHPGKQDPLCALEKKEISPVQNLIERETGTASDESQCLPGSEWESNCHRCRCLESGFAECDVLDSCVQAELGEPVPCKPNTTFRRNGTTCICLENGLGLCTLRFTTGDGRRQHKREISEAHNSLIEHLRVKRAVCNPNSEFNVDCNPCKCAANGLSYTCTHNECLEGANTNTDVEVFMETEGDDHVEQHSVCKARATFYVGCNTCRCNSLGTDYSCTNKPCPLPKDVELFHELKATVASKVAIPAATKLTNSTKVVCVANRMFIKDCNTCWCNEDGTSYFCTRRVCIEMPDRDTEDLNQELNLRVIRKECRPNEIFELDCNMCRCNPDGKSYSCTRRGCVEMDEKNVTSRSARALPETAPKACQPGQEFRLDCNKCLCDNDGQNFSCTRIDCAARRRRDTTAQMSVECVPGSVFDRECNVCRCTDDGKHAACTLKRCQRDHVTTEPSTSFRCTPGDQFRRDCNDCTCSADGTNVFCTLRLCDEVLSDI